jgi:hypothetical protein
MRRREFSTLLGGAATASTVSPLPLSAQQREMPVIGFLGAVTPGQSALSVAGFRQGLSESAIPSLRRSRLWRRPVTPNFWRPPQTIAYGDPMPTSLTPPTLERILQGLHESEIRCGIQNEPPAGGITAWIDYGSRTEKATFYGTIVGDRQVWPATDRIAAWLHETALRLFPDSPYAKEHSTEAPKKPTKLAKS